MSGLWLCDANADIRALYDELAPGNVCLPPDEVLARLDRGEVPTGVVIDDLSLARLPNDARLHLLGRTRVVVCTASASEAAALLPSAGVVQARIMEKPFSLDQFAAAVEWLTAASGQPRAG